LRMIKLISTPIECISDSKLRRQVEKSVKQMQLQKSTIHTAARDGRLTELVNLISSGVDINLQLINGKTALYIAVQNKQVDIVKFLLKQGANPELSHKTYTPLQMACRIDEPTIRLRMIKLLINAGANPLALDSNHQTPNNQTSDETIQNLMQFLEKMSQLTELTEPNHTATIFEINPVLRQIESFISQPAKEQLFASTKDIQSKEQAIFIANRLTKTHNPLTR
ncbi:MAG: ankyrin repeat domain-containing protein, partial [Gammaproteobacteria bacterium]|nr:ankyrin repeat domain-containing protein [Gammaproteobacteria bacterium]